MYPSWEKLCGFFRKTNKKGAQAIAFFISKDMLPEAHLKEGINAELASLIAIRDYMVKMRTSALNKRGIKVEKQALGSGKGFARPGLA